MQDTVLLIDGSTDRRRLLRAALERRGCVVAGEAGSVSEMVDVIAHLHAAPSTVLVGSSVTGASSERIARLLKRTWPGATVIQEAPRANRLREAVAV